MRSFGRISSFAAISLLTIMSCVLDPATDQPSTEAQSQELRSSKLDDPPAVASDTAGEEAAIGSPVGDAITPRANCSIVQFCNASGSDGSVCQQQGCSLGPAENECKAEVKTVCGAATCPLIFVTSSGSRITLGCPPTVCSGGAIECGGHCCGTSATFCAGSSCCDGVHSGGGCPI